jgi:tetratricopeptide (TPR) repeat protein
LGRGQKELANCVKCTISEISYWESGKRRPNERQAELLSQCLKLASHEQDHLVNWILGLSGAEFTTLRHPEPKVGLEQNLFLSASYGAPAPIPFSLLERLRDLGSTQSVSRDVGKALRELRTKKLVEPVQGGTSNQGHTSTLWQLNQFWVPFVQDDVSDMALMAQYLAIFEEALVNEAEHVIQTQDRLGVQPYLMEHLRHIINQNDSRVDHEMFRLCKMYGLLLYRQGDLLDALKQLVRARDMVDQSPGIFTEAERPLVMSRIYEDVGLVLFDLGKIIGQDLDEHRKVDLDEFEGAEHHWEVALKHEKLAQGSNPDHVARLYKRLADVRLARGKFYEAALDYRAALDTWGDASQARSQLHIELETEVRKLPKRQESFWHVVWELYKQTCLLWVLNSERAESCQEQALELLRKNGITPEDPAWKAVEEVLRKLSENRLKHSSN